MNTEIEQEISRLLDVIEGEQHHSMTMTGKCYKVIGGETEIENLTYNVLNYWNDIQGCGYGVEFLLDQVESDGPVTYHKSIDVGFCDPDFVIEGYHPVAEFDWREKEESISIV